MSNLREAAERALGALEYHVEQTRPIASTLIAISVLRAALEEPKQQLPMDRYRIECVDNYDLELDANGWLVLYDDVEDAINSAVLAERNRLLAPEKEE